MKFWYQPQLTFGAALLYPFSRLYRKLAYRRYAQGMKFASCDPQAKALHVPVIVVGNITVGGTGKTPMVRFLIGYLNAMGFKVGVVSRGYGGSYTGVHHLQAGDPASLVGDEMAMQFAYCQRQNLKVEFVVCRERIKAALKCQELGVDFIISDDGLQHYALPRHIEIALIGPQALGNRQFIPAGPLREDVSRLRRVDFIINNSSQREWGGYKMTHNSFALVPVHAIAQQSPALCSVEHLESGKQFAQHLVLNWISILSVSQPQQLLTQLQNWATQLGWNTTTQNQLEILARELLATLGYASQSATFTTEELTSTTSDASIQAVASPESTSVTSTEADSRASSSTTTTSSTSATENNSTSVSTLDATAPHNYNTAEWNHALEQMQRSALMQFIHEQASELQLERVLQESQGYSVTAATNSATDSNPTSTSPYNFTSNLELTQGYYLPSLRLYQDTFAAINSSFVQRVQVEQTSSADSTFATVAHDATQVHDVTDVDNGARTPVTPAPESASSFANGFNSHLGNPLPSTCELQVNSEEFQQFLNKQFCLETASYQEFITKSLTRLSSIHILPSLFQATYPQVVALSAIGYPQGFTKTLQEIGFNVLGELVFGDHHSFTQADLDQIYTSHPEYRGLPLVCTEKDAIKLQHLSIPAPTFFVEREGLFLEHPRWLDQLKEKIVTIYNSSK